MAWSLLVRTAVIVWLTAACSTAYAQNSGYDALGAAGQGDGSGSCAAGDKICAAAKERFLFLSEEAAKASARGEKAPSDPDGADNSLARNSEPLDSSGFRAILRNAGIEYVRFYIYLIRHPLPHSPISYVVT